MIPPSFFLSPDGSLFLCAKGERKGSSAKNQGKRFFFFGRLPKIARLLIYIMYRFDGVFLISFYRFACVRRLNVVG
jgi:hypothetical protein